MSDQCERCKATISGLQRQEGFPGLTTKLCLDCQSYDRAVHMLKMLPDEGDNEWDELNSWEQKFVMDMRGKIPGMSKISPAQYDKIDQIYEKLG